MFFAGRSSLSNLPPKFPRTIIEGEIAQSGRGTSARGNALFSLLRNVKCAECFSVKKSGESCCCFHDEPMAVQLQEDMTSGRSSMTELLRLAKLTSAKLELAPVQD
jgi:hypothetical protein